MIKIFFFNLIFWISLIGCGEPKSNSIDNFESLDFGKEIWLGTFFNDNTNPAGLLEFIFTPFKAVLKSDTTYGFSLKYTTSENWIDDYRIIPKGFVIQELNLAFLDGSFKKLKPISFKEKIERNASGFIIHVVESYFLVKNLNDFEKPVVEFSVMDLSLNRYYPVFGLSQKQTKSYVALKYSYTIPYSIGLMQNPKGSCSFILDGTQREEGFPTHLKKLTESFSTEFEDVENCKCK